MAHYGEDVILSSKLRLKGEECEVLLTLTEDAVYERVLSHTPDAEAEEIRWEYRDVHSVRKEEGLALSIWLLGAHGAKSKVKEKLKGWGSGEMASNHLSEKEFTCNNEEERSDLYRIVKKLSMDAWQYFFEVEGPIKPPEIYQGHLFLTKRNRKGKFQIRFIVMSNRKMYNMEAKISSKTRVEVHKCKWAFPLSDIKAVATYTDEPIALTLTVDTQHSEKKKVKDSVTYLVDNQTERDFCIAELRRLYYLSSRQELSVITQGLKGQ
jgi:hypothetical protein